MRMFDRFVPRQFYDLCRVSHFVTPNFGMVAANARRSGRASVAITSSLSGAK